jgi:predicted aminopeptidase
MRSRKKDCLATLYGDLNDELVRAGRELPAWLSDGLNNARLASMSLYQGRLVEFRALLAKCDNDMACFYDAARELADKSVLERSWERSNN